MKTQYMFNTEDSPNRRQATVSVTLKNCKSYTVRTQQFYTQNRSAQLIPSHQEIKIQPYSFGCHTCNCHG